MLLYDLVGCSISGLVATWKVYLVRLVAQHTRTQKTPLFKAVDLIVKYLGLHPRRGQKVTEPEEQTLSNKNVNIASMGK